MHEEAKPGRQLLLILTLVTISFSISFVAANATSAPTMDLTTTSSIAGATASYAFHVENPTSGFYNAFSVTVPAGYTVDPTYLTTTPDIVLPGFTGSFGPFPFGSLTVKTTTTSGQFRIFAAGLGFSLAIGSATIVPPTSSSAGTVSGSLDLPYTLDPGMYVNLNVVVINPSTPGVYTWGPNTITLFGGAPAPMNPRAGYTNQVTIVSPPSGVGGFEYPIDRVRVLSAFFTQSISEYWWILATAISIGVAAVLLEKRRAQ